MLSLTIFSLTIWSCFTWDQFSAIKRTSGIIRESYSTIVKALKQARYTDTNQWKSPISGMPCLDPPTESRDVMCPLVLDVTPEPYLYIYIWCWLVLFCIGASMFIALKLKIIENNNNEVTSVMCYQINCCICCWVLALESSNALVKKRWEWLAYFNVRQCFHPYNWKPLQGHTDHFSNISSRPQIFGPLFMFTTNFSCNF